MHSSTRIVVALLTLACADPEPPAARPEQVAEAPAERTTVATVATAPDDEPVAVGDEHDGDEHDGDEHDGDERDEDDTASGEQDNTASGEQDNTASGDSREEALRVQIPAAAPTLLDAVPGPSPLVLSTRDLLDAPVSERAAASPAVLEALGGARVRAAARVGAPEADHLLYVVHERSAALERWASARADGTYEARRAALAAEIRRCLDDDEDQERDCEWELDTEQHPTDVRLELARFEVRSGVVSRTGTVLVTPVEARRSAIIRRIEDADADGRLEVSLGVRQSMDTGQFGHETWTFFWFDGDTLHPQLSLERRSWSFGCSGEVRERSGFGLRDRNSDGHPDMGVRHAVWADQGEGAPDWPDPTCTRVHSGDAARDLAIGMPWEMVESLTGVAPPEDYACPYYEGRWRHLYEPATDEWGPPVAVP